jgi:hypothetical protein
MLEDSLIYTVCPSEMCPDCRVVSVLGYSYFENRLAGKFHARQAPWDAWKLIYAKSYHNIHTIKLGIKCDKNPEHRSAWVRMSALVTPSELLSNKIQ